MRDLHRRPDDDQELLLAFAEYTVKSAVVAYAAGLTRLYGALITESIRSAHEALLLELKGGPGSGPPLGNQNARKHAANEEDIARWTKRVADLEAEKARMGKDWTAGDEENLQSAQRILAQMEGKPAKPVKPGPAPENPEWGPQPKDGKLLPKEWVKRRDEAAAIVREMMNTVPDVKGTWFGVEALATNKRAQPSREQLLEWRKYVESVIGAWTGGEPVANVLKPRWLWDGESSLLLNEKFKRLRAQQEGMSDSEEAALNEHAKKVAARERRGEDVPRNPPPRPHSMGPFPLGGPLKR